MTKEPLVVGLDVGTAVTKFAVAKRLRPDKEPAIIALGTASTEGLRRGVVVDIQDATRSIVIAHESAAKMIEDDVHEVIVGLNGSHLSCHHTLGKVAVSRADGEVTEEDIARVFTNANPGPSGQNKTILDVVPKTFVLDEESGIKNPVGMNGIKLELEALVIEGSSSPVKNVEKCVHEAGLQIEREVVGALAASESVLTKKQKDLGVMMLDIGAGTTSMAVYEEGRLIHVAVIPIGAGHITNDIAIGMRTSIEVAEKVKLKYGAASEDELDGEGNLQIDLSKVSPEEVGVFPVSYVAAIIEARLKEIYDYVLQELKSIEREGLLPAGAVLVGGGANLRGIVEMSKRELRLPVKIGIPQGVEGSIADVDNPTYATMVGLVLSGFDETGDEDLGVAPGGDSGSSGGIGDMLKGMIKTFLPE